jgi:hypothetical protein
MNIGGKGSQVSDFLLKKKVTDKQERKYGINLTLLE